MEINTVRAGMDGITAGAVHVVVNEYQEDAFLIQLSVSGTDTAGLAGMVPLDPRGARQVAQDLLKAADAAEDNRRAFDGEAES
jgi:hypothetical protein